MVNPLVFIEVHGVKRGLLFTPSLSIGARERGWEIELQPNTKDLALIYATYVKLFYVAAYNYHRVHLFDNNNEGEFDLTLVDIEIWAALHKEEIPKLIEIAVESLTDTTIKKLAQKIQKEEEEEVKKKSVLLGIMSRLKRFWLGKGLQRDKRPK